MERVDRFLVLFKKLEEYLQCLYDNGGNTKQFSFSIGVDNLVKRYSIFEQKTAKLKSYGKLRNILAHNSDSKGEYIAEPSESALQEFQQLVQAIVAPPKLIPKFEKDICTFSLQEPLTNALQHMRKEDYSQVVVQNEGKLLLLTVEGVARWLEEQTLEDIISVKDATIADALKYEQKEPVSVASCDKTVYDVVELFTPSITQKKPRIYALLITEHGKETEKLLGIITPWDLLSIVNL